MSGSATPPEERRTTGGAEQQPNGLLCFIQKRWMPWALMITSFGAAALVLERCQPAVAAVIGVRTVVDADAVQKKNDETHTEIFESIRVQQKADRHIGYKIEDVDEAMLEEIKSRSPKRYNKIRDTRKKRWRERHRYETELEENEGL